MRYAISAQAKFDDEQVIYNFLSTLSKDSKLILPAKSKYQYQKIAEMMASKLGVSVDYNEQIPDILAVLMDGSFELKDLRITC